VEKSRQGGRPVKIWENPNGPRGSGIGWKPASEKQSSKKKGSELRKKEGPRVRFGGAGSIKPGNRHQSKERPLAESTSSKASKTSKSGGRRRGRTRTYCFISRSVSKGKKKGPLGGDKDLLGNVAAAKTKVNREKTGSQ